MVLERRGDEPEATLSIEARDLGERTLTLRMLENSEGWEHVSDVDVMSKIRAGRQTLQAMLEHPESLDGLTVKQLAAYRQTSVANIGKQLEHLERDEWVWRERSPPTAMGKRPDLWHLTAMALQQLSAQP
jgi:hypothetical protein